MSNLTHYQSKSKSVRGLASSQFGHALYALAKGNFWLIILVLRNLYTGYSADADGVLLMCWHCFQKVDQGRHYPFAGGPY